MSSSRVSVVGSRIMNQGTAHAFAGKMVEEKL